MRIVVRNRSAQHLLVTDGVLDGATMLHDLLAPVSHLFDDAASGLPHRLFVDNHLVSVDLSVAQASLVDGSVVSSEPADEPHRPRATQVSIDITGGLNAGRRHAVLSGRVVVGRSPDADVVVSASTVDRHHLAIDPVRDGLMVTDLATVNGTIVDGEWLLDATCLRAGSVIDVGAAQLTVRAPDDDRPDELLTLRGRTACGTLPFNRPPRHHGPLGDETITVPAEASPGGFGSFFSWAGLLAPLAMGALMAWLYNPLWALFALLGPVMMVGSWLEGRRRSSKASRRSRVAVEAAVSRLEHEIGVRRGAELGRRRDRYPDLAELIRRVDQPSTRLWQRRLHDPDALELVVGTADLVWPLEPICDGRPEPRALQLLDSLAHLDNAPLVASLRSGEVIGLVGERAATLAVARSVVLQATIHHGPADVEVVVLAADGHGDSWRFIEWLPHSRSRVSRGRDRALAVGEAAISELAAGLVAVAAADQDGGPMLLCVVDGDGLTTARAAPARAVLGGAAGRAAGVVIASSSDRLPHSCTTVIEVTDSDGLGRVAFPQTATVHENVLLAGTDEDTATDAARRLARFADPEVDLTEASIPASVSLLDLLSMPAVDAASIVGHWAASVGTSGLCAPIGADGMGPLTIDLVRDGPHALVGGTTGSGKSELLRTVVAALAARYDAEHLNFVLIDYKGGSAFDTCALLPHTVGLVTDLDEHLGARALTCLEAELHHREQVLRDVGATDIDEYRSTARLRTSSEPLPRLVVVIDEFATMAAELPDFLDALVGIAQRGRSLGVHLILATQRPSGAVSPSIRTNTSLRIALRVLDAADSSDVIDTVDAASIGRDQPGRAYVRLGPTEVLPFQSALVTGLSEPGGHGPVRLIPQGEAAGASGAARVASGDESPDSDLDRLVAAIRTAHRQLDLGRPRRPWPDPLPATIALCDLPDPEPSERNRRIPIGLADEPRRQRQTTAHWNLDAGNIAFVGMTGSGTTTALATIACSLADSLSPSRLHVYGVDRGAGGLRELADLPHVGAMIDGAGRSRQLRLVKRLDGERRRRSALSTEALAREPRLVVLVDGFGSWRDDLESGHHTDAIDVFGRVYADGPPLGIHCAIAADHVGAIPRQLTAVTSQLLLFRLADPADYLTAGLRIASTETMPAGRAFRADTGQEVHVALPHAEGVHCAVESIGARYTSDHIAVPTIGELPTDITVEALGAGARLDGDASWIPVGIGDDDLEVAGFELYRGEHALIAGRARTGKSSALRAIARSTATAGAFVVALAPGRSPLLSEPSVALASSEVEEIVAAMTRRRAQPIVLLVDDADTIDDASGALTRLLGDSGADDGCFHAVVAGRTDRLLGSYGHWSSAVRSSRTGVLLCPEILDGDLFALQLPPRTELPALPGRGWLVSHGSRQVCHMATGDLPVRSVPNDAHEHGHRSRPTIAADSDAVRRSA